MLDVQNISKTFNPGTVNEKKALSGLSLHLDKGEFVTIVGSNGAGKSTLFNAISGSFFVDEGHIALNGKDITYVPEHKRSRVIGRLFQDPLRGTAPHMTIEENLSLAYLRTNRSKAAFSHVSKQEKAFFQERLALLDMGLENRMQQPVGLLSGGQREKVLQLTDSVIAEHKITCLMVTHNMSQALSLGNRTLMMADGRIILDLSGQERAGMSVESMVERFRVQAGQALDNDRILLS